VSKLHKFLIGVAITGVITAAIVLSGVKVAYTLFPWGLFVIWYLWFVDPQEAHEG
jgi:TM2 domain-containing membrane protein YozV